MLRSLLVMLVLALGSAAQAASAQPVGTPLPAEPRNGGMIDGKVASVDYQRSVLALDAAGHGRIEVEVMPSTSVQGNGAGYRAIIDIKRGQRVQIFASIAGGKYVAQIIRIVK